MLGLTLAAYPFAQFFGSPILGSLSDRFGRKKLLILTMVGTGIGYLLSGLAIAHHQVSLLILSRVMTGFFEGNMGIAQASISDLKIDKHDGLGAILAASSFGYLVGPLIGGFLCDKQLVGWFGYAVPFYFGTVMALLLGIFVTFCYQETFNQASQIVLLFQNLTS
jgi:DHA1 family tetracycline resistance protein-like MFS transporter